MSVNPIILSIDGNIGAGKSTFLNYLKNKYPKWHFIDEPVDTWTRFVNEDNESLLEVFYKDRKRWSYTFQNCAFLTRVRSITKAINDWKVKCKTNPSEAENNIFVTERSIETDYNVFAKMLHEDKSLNLMEWNMYKQWYHYLSVDTKVNGIIYITCNPEKCKERILLRSRTGEDGIPLDYLTQLHKYHDDWIDNTTTPVLKIDTENMDFRNEELEYPSEKFDNFIKTI